MGDNIHTLIKLINDDWYEDYVYVFTAFRFYTDFIVQLKLIQKIIGK